VINATGDGMETLARAWCMEKGKCAFTRRRPDGCMECGVWAGANVKCMYETNLLTQQPLCRRREHLTKTTEIKGRLAKTNRQPHPTPARGKDHPSASMTLSHATPESFLRSFHGAVPQNAYRACCLAFVVSNVVSSSEKKHAAVSLFGPDLLQAT
jgi:hypothetical protein